MLKIVNSKLISNITPLVISSFQKTIEVIGAYPISSIVWCYINGYTEEVRFPLTCVQLVDDGYLFRGQMFMHKKLVEYMNNNKDKTFTISFKINNEDIEGEQIILINYESVMSYINTLPDTVTQIAQNVNQLAARLDSYITNKISTEQLNGNKIQKGMSPIAIDNYGNYIWDYPFAKEKELLKNISIILQGVSEQLNIMNDRITKVEQQVLNHVYETYDL